MLLRLKEEVNALSGEKRYYIEKRVWFLFFSWWRPINPYGGEYFYDKENALKELNHYQELKSWI